MYPPVSHRGQHHTPHPGDSGGPCSARVLVADGDSTDRQTIVTFLSSHEILAVAASSQNDLMSQLAVSNPDLVILDLQILKHSGFGFLREIRARYDVPVITIGYPCAEIDPVAGLETGADDHLAKPLSLRELQARIKAIIRRRPVMRTIAQRTAAVRCCAFCGWQLDQLTRRLTAPDRRIIVLTKGEYSLLLAFLRAPGLLLSRQTLLRSTRVHEDISDRSIDVQILRLRRKLKTGSDAPPLIRTERGLGYVFTSSVKRIEHDM